MHRILQGRHIGYMRASYFGEERAEHVLCYIYHAVSLHHAGGWLPVGLNHLFPNTHLFLTEDYERTKQARNKPKNRDQPRESVLSKCDFGSYVAIAGNIL